MSRNAGSRTGTKTKPMPRRSFLRGVLAGGASVSLGLPVLESMLNENGTAFAQGDELPRRFGVYYWGNGILHSAWVPSRTGTDWDVPDSLQPFIDINPDLKSYLTLITGTNHTGSTPGHIPAHGIGLSSSHDEEYVSASRGPGYRNHTYPEPSIDVIVRDAWKGKAYRDWVGTQITQADPYEGDISWEAGGQVVNEPDRTPRALFDRLFSAGLPEQEQTSEQAELRRVLRGSMLDAVLEDFRTLKSRLPAGDRQRLDSHVEGIRDLERRLQSMESTQSGSTCEAPAEPGSGSTPQQKSEIISEILATAMACDLTRVVSYEWSSHQSNYVYSELGISGTHHSDISHGLGDSTHREEKRRIMRLIMHGLAYFAEQLRQKTEPNGENLLDRTLLCATSEHANPNRHDYRDHPFLFVGGAGGSIRTGQHWRHPDPDGNSDAPNVLLTAVRAVGVQREKLGMSARTDSRGDQLPSRETTETISGIEV